MLQTILRTARVTHLVMPSLMENVIKKAHVFHHEHVTIGARVLQQFSSA